MHTSGAAPRDSATRAAGSGTRQLRRPGSGCSARHVGKDGRVGTAAGPAAPALSHVRGERTQAASSREAQNRPISGSASRRSRRLPRAGSTQLRRRERERPAVLRAGGGRRGAATRRCAGPRPEARVCRAPRASAAARGGRGGKRPRFLEGPRRGRAGRAVTRRAREESAFGARFHYRRRPKSEELLGVMRCAALGSRLRCPLKQGKQIRKEG